ncbi:MAG: tyrosine-type recombinase/integrase [Ignisphaera sp.]|nr:tyrosine-type recombinase/integrase [Ignisphaera sp.]
MDKLRLDVVTTGFDTIDGLLDGTITPEQANGISRVMAVEITAQGKEVALKKKALTSKGKELVVVNDAIDVDIVGGNTPAVIGGKPSKFIKISISGGYCAKGLYLLNEGGRFDKYFIINDISKTDIKPPFKIILRTKVTLNGKSVERKKTESFTHKSVTLIQAVKKMTIEKDTFREVAIAPKPIIEPVKVSLKPVPALTNGTLNADWDLYIQTKKDNASLSIANIKTQEWTYDKWIRPTVGSYQTKEVDTEDLQAIVNHMRDQGKATRTTKLIKDYLRPFFNEKKIVPNPAVDIVIPTFDNEVHFKLSDEKSAELISAMENYPEPTIRGVFGFLLDGRRLGETLLMKWEFVDRVNKEYTVHALTAKSGRTSKYQIQDELDLALEGITKTSDYVFPAMKDPSLPMSKETVRNHWEKMTASIGVKMRIHDVRHLIGSTLVNAGESLETIAAVLGHSSTAVTKRYSEVKKETASKAVSKFRGSFKKAIVTN